MAYPYSTITVGKGDATTMAADHPPHHNASAAALNDLLTELGSAPRGGTSTNLTERLAKVDTAVIGLVAGSSISASLTAAAAAVTTYGEAVWKLLPGNHIGGVNESFSVPTGLHVDMTGATLRCRGTGQFKIDAPDSIYQNIEISGNDDAGSTALVVIGTGSGGDGSKAQFRGLHIRQIGAGRIACHVRGLQNSDFYGYRHTDCIIATGFGLKIDDGSKNLNFFGTWPTQIKQGNIWITTSDIAAGGGAGNGQRTSKINFVGGLTESGPVQVLDAGIILGDCEDISIANFAFNGGSPAGTDAVACVSDGNRAGSAHGPSSISVFNTQFKGWTNAFRMGTNTEVLTGQLSGSGVTNLYHIDHASAVIRESPHFIKPAAWWTNKSDIATVGGVETTYIKTATYSA